MNCACFGQLSLPDLSTELPRQTLVFDCQMDAAYDCLIKLDHPVRCEEQDALVIFQFPKENGHEAVVRIVIRRTLLHKCICLIQEKHSIEMLGNLKNGFELLLKRIRITVVDNKLTD